MGEIWNSFCFQSPLSSLSVGIPLVRSFDRKKPASPFKRRSNFSSENKTLTKIILLFNWSVWREKELKLWITRSNRKIRFQSNIKEHKFPFILIFTQKYKCPNFKLFRIKHLAIGTVPQIFFKEISLNILYYIHCCW
jgi:hypothetical protein